MLIGEMVAADYSPTVTVVIVIPLHVSTQNP